MCILIINLYKINPDNSYGGMEESHSEVAIDIANYTPPKGYTFSPPVDPSYLWDGDSWTAPHVPTLEELKEAKKVEIAQARYEAETAGILGIKTDRESQALLTGAVLQAFIDPTYSLNWKTVDGTFVELGYAEIMAVGNVVRTHVQDQFNKESEIRDKIDACTTVEEVAAITYE